MILVNDGNKRWTHLVLGALTLLLSACGGGGSGSGTGAGVDPAAEVVSEFSGSVGDGPIVGATLKFYDKRGELLKTLVSDNTASYSTRIRARRNAFPITVEATGGTDLVTGRAPDFTLSSVLVDHKNRNVNINPYSTLIVEAARSMSGGLNAQNVDVARGYVLGKLAYGLDTREVSDPIGFEVSDSNIADIVKSSETLGEMIRRTRDEMRAFDAGIGGDEVLATLARDISDGALDGRLADTPLSTQGIRTSLVARLTSAQVLIETLSNSLKVDGLAAREKMDEAVVMTHPAISRELLTDSVPVTAVLLDQLVDALRTAGDFDGGSEIDAIVQSVQQIQPDSSPADAERVLPADSSDDLRTALNTVSSSTDQQLADNTGTVPDDSSGGGGTSPVPALAIAGTPPAIAREDSRYAFTPTVSGGAGGSVSFAVSGKPQWASFSATTGQLSGVPTNAHVGSYTGIVISAIDSTGSVSLAPFSITVVNTNDAPSIAGNGSATMNVAQFYSFQPSASDPDGDTLTFGISNKPAWASFNASTGRLSGTPGTSDAGVTSNNIVISVSDGAASASLAGFSITVNPIVPSNRAPTISGTPAGSVAEGGNYAFQPSASDADGDTLVFSISGKPAWASFNTGTGRLSGTPGSAAAGSYGNIVIGVSDGKVSAALAPFSINVTNVNRAPVISGSPSRTVNEGSSYSFQPSASDADGDALTFSISNKPSWASFNSGSGRLSGTPGNANVGSYTNITIRVSDGQDTVSMEPFSISVSNVNDAPVISGTPSRTVNEGSPYSFQPSASDADGDTLTFSISNKPSWASFNSGSGRLSGTPGNANVGNYTNITIRVSDGQDTVSMEPFSISVSNVNDVPVISGTPSTSVEEGTAYSFRPSASDADGDTLTFSVSNRPAWATFNSGTGLLSGTPGNAHVGTYGNIVVSVSDGSNTVSLPAFNIVVTAAAQTTPTLGAFTVIWNPPVDRTDGQAIAVNELNKYTLYYGTSSGNYTSSVAISDPYTTSATVSDLPLGTYYIVVTATDSGGRESAYSGEVVKQAQ